MPWLIEGALQVGDVVLFHKEGSEVSERGTILWFETGDFQLHQSEGRGEFDKLETSACMRTKDGVSYAYVRNIKLESDLLALSRCSE